MNLFVPRRLCDDLGVVARRAAALLLSAVLVSSCAGSSRAKSARTTAATTTTVSSLPSTTRSAAPATTTGPSTTHTPTTPPTTAPRQATVSEPDNGSTVSVPAGTTLTLVLHSTYWTIDPSSNPAVLAERGSPTVDPQTQGCVPGQGCGTVTARFGAVAAGTATISAHRSSCGEALRCTPDQSSYRILVRVNP